VKHWGSDEELYDTLRRELFTAVVGDVMDTMGLLRQFLPPQIKPLRNDMVVTGRALTVLEADVPSGTDFVSEPFGLMLRALDDLKAEEVYICTGGSPWYALWGELMSTRAINLGAAGAVVDGYHRDTRGILQLGFPTFDTPKIRRRAGRS
jgi:regulator of RNase E activity RraA